MLTAAQVQANFDQACSFHRQGQLAKALALYEELLAFVPDHVDALHLSGLIAAQTNNQRKAVELIGKAIAIYPGNPAFYWNRGLALQELNEFEEAVASFDNAIAIKPDFYDAYVNRGFALLGLKKFDAALESFDNAISLKPDNHISHFNRGYALQNLGKLEAAIECFDQAISLKPDVPEAYSNRGMALQELKKLNEALSSYNKAISIKPDFAEAYSNRGNTLQQLKQYDTALASYDKAISIKPDFAEAYFNRGNTLQELKQYDAALESFDKAIALKPDYHQACYNRGTLFHELKQLDAALASYEQTISLKPDYHQAYVNRAVVLKLLKQPDSALASFDKAISLKPDYADAYSNRGNLLHEQLRLDEALASYDKAISLKPDFADAYWNKSLTLLLSGNFRQGWELYEWRWKKEKFTSPRRDFTQPIWLGEGSIAGKTILLHSEQGLGDTIQFCRYVPLVADLGARVILETDCSLAGILDGLRGLSQQLVKGSTLPDFDCHCPLMSLPLAFKTDIDTIPFSRQYLKCVPDKLSQWKKRLGKQTKPRIGLAWSGSIMHSNDHNRSIPLSAMSMHLPKGFTYVSLQKDVRDIDKPTLESNPNILHFGDELKDFTDTAALCELMDVVISVDTSVAHVNAALGNPTWVLLPFSPDWRWLLDRDDSPWYPDVRLFRQQKPDDWAEAFEKLKSALLTVYGG